MADTPANSRERQLFLDKIICFTIPFFRDQSNIPLHMDPSRACTLTGCIAAFFDRKCIWNCLRKRSEYRRPVCHAAFKFTGNTDRTDIHTIIACSTGFFIYIARFLPTVTLKLPMNPSTFSTSLLLNRVMFLWLPTSTIFGVRIQAEQSRVGKVLSNCAICPPMEGSFSTR